MCLKTKTVLLLESQKLSLETGHISEENCKILVPLALEYTVESPPISRKYFLRLSLHAVL